MFNDLNALISRFQRSAFLYGRNRAFLPIILLLLQAGCAGTASNDVGQSGPPKLSAEECAGFDQLLLDPQFETLGQAGSVWRYRQHAGEQSFTATAENGQLDFARISDEPWAVVQQKITDPRLSGRVVRYSADLTGDVSQEVTHGFGAKSGLFLQLGPRPDANMADHEPNIGQWDWQRITVEAEVPEIFDYVELGFIYQGGEGAFSAKAPKLELLDCQ